MTRKPIGLVVLLPALCCLGIVAPGCQKDDIQTYKAPKPVEVQDTPELGDGPRDRMLAAVIPHGEELWFLKMQGPEKLVSTHKAEFDQVLHSFRFLDQKEKPVAWTTPPGWTAQPETKMRYATLSLDSKDAPLEMTVTRLPGGGGILANINRWRKQLGLNPIPAVDLSKVTTAVKLESTTAVCVDFVGVAQQSAAMARMPENHPQDPPPEAAAPSPFEYTLPNGWAPLPDAGGPISPVAAFRVLEGNQEAKTTVTRVRGQLGSLAENVDRWRGQVGLPASTPEDLKNIREISVGGIRSPYVDLIGAKTGGREAMRMLAAVVTQGESTWYFKMMGPVDLIGRQKPAFEAFMSSVRFQGGPHG